jgi:hypothetical protein
VPPDQGWSHFRALQHFGKAPVKFVVFPGEPHSLKKLSHRIRKVEEDMAWFDRYLYKTDSAANPALKPDPPLRDAIAKDKMPRVLGAYGTQQSRDRSRTPKSFFPIPEVVKRGDLEIGRFEVTAAQYAEFKNQRRPDAADANRPVPSVRLEDALAYANWLSNITHETWRLPYEDEVKDLYDKRDGENTLDYWAGYAPNPEDTAGLREKAKELGGAAPLLKEVGNFRGQGNEHEEPMYDLGGNVAEWVLTREGKGKIVGGSADCPANEASNCTPADEYIGFRVVRGAPKPPPPQAPSP